MTGLSRAEQATLRQLKARERESRKASREAKRKTLPRSDTGKATRGRERNTAYLAYLRRQPCRIGVGCIGPVQAAHLRYTDLAAGRTNPGLSVKPSDCWATSLCAHHHAEQHARGNEHAWWASYGLDGTTVARTQFAAFTAEESNNV